MKFIFKLIIGLLVFVLLVVGVPLAIMIITIADNTNNAPTELYHEELTLKSELTTLLDTGFDLKDKDYLELSFTEDSLNKIIFSTIRKNINPEFMPTETCSADSCKYIKVEEVKLPVLGVKKAIVKNIYAEINDNQLAIYMPMSIMGINTRGKVIAAFNEDSDNFIIDFEALGLGKANLLSGIASKIMFEVFQQMQFTEDSINQILENENLPLEFILKDFAFKISKDKVNQLLKKMINPEGMDESNEKEMLTELLTTLTDKDNDLVDFGIFNEKFGIRFDLKKFKVDNSLVTLSEDVTNFDKDHFVTNKVQSFIFTNLVETSNSKIKFTNNEFNQIIYDQSEGYKQFKVEIPIPETDSKINFEVIGILIDFNPTTVMIRINIDINGLKSSFKVSGQIVQNNNAEVIIKIDDNITVGEDINEETSNYLIANSDLILNMLGDNISDLGVMTYVKTLKSFILSVDSFKKLMAVDGNNNTPLTVSKLNIVEDGIEVYASIAVTNPLSQQITTVTEVISNVLNTNNFTADDFNTENTDEAENINDLLSTLDSVADGLTNNNLTEEDTNKLIENLNSISEENRQIFLNSIETDANSEDLLSLYDSLFGK